MDVNFPEFVGGLSRISNTNLRTSSKSQFFNEFLVPVLNRLPGSKKQLTRQASAPTARERREAERRRDLGGSSAAAGGAAGKRQQQPKRKEPQHPTTLPFGSMEKEEGVADHQAELGKGEDEKVEVVRTTSSVASIV